jgi:hypothetical protein
MNTLGKILVILNFVVALVVVAFVTLKFATETNWKTGVDKLQEELVMSRKSSQAHADTSALLQTQLTKTKSELEAKNLDIAFKEAQWKSLEDKLLQAYKDAESRGQLTDIGSKKAQEAMERMAKEVENLKGTVGEREKIILDLHAKLKNTLDLTMELDRNLKFSQDRNQGLLGRVQELERHNAEIVSGVKPDAASALAKDPTAPSPPVRYMKGKIERVDSKDNSLVSVSLGTDHGLKVGNTLEVYRRLPVPQYIGIVRIEDAHHHSSVGRLIRVPGTPQRPILEGDEVSSSIIPR